MIPTIDELEKAILKRAVEDAGYDNFDDEREEEEQIAEMP